MARVRGPNPNVLGRLAETIDALANVPSRAARPVADAINDLLEEEFEEGKAPNGIAWASLAPRTLKRHGPPPLTHTGEMRDGTVAAPTAGKGVAITVPFPGGIHQTGASDGDWHMPARPILPVNGLPAKWKKAIDKAISDTTKKKGG